MNTVALIFVSAGVGAILAAIGAALFVISRREPEIKDPERDLPAGADKVLFMLTSSVVIVDVDDKVIRASAPAFALGLVHDYRLTDAKLNGLVAEVRRDGQIREMEMTLESPGRPPRYVAARVAPLTRQLTVAFIVDKTQERQVEAIRRDFVANVSHELKTPLGALQLLADAVREANNDPEIVVQFANRMSTEVERLNTLVQQVIDLSRLQGDKLVENPEFVEVEALVSEALSHVATEAQSRDIDILTEIETDLVLLGDRDQLGSAINNLLTNAVAYSEPSGRVEVIARTSDGTIKVTVTDHGPGIEHAEQERIFERFYRVDPARHRSTGGTGLGLSIVKHVAASHGGAVYVESEPGEGASFTLMLPEKRRRRRDQRKGSE